MTLNSILLFGILTVITSSNGQVNTNLPKDITATSKPSPVVIRTPLPQGFHFDGVVDTTLVSQYIRSIYHDSKGNLWFGTAFEGVCKYDGDTLTYYTKLDVFDGNSVYSIAEDKHGNIWFGTDQGVYKYDGKTFRNYNQKDGLNHLYISRKSILVDKSGTVWVGTHGGVFQYDPSADSKGGQSFSLFQQLPPINVTGIMEDKSGNIWFASFENGVFRYNPSALFLAGEKTITNIAEKEELGKNYAGGIAEDKAGNMWFTMKNGICKYDGKTFTEYTHKDGLGGTEFWGIYIEESGIIWVTARGSTTRYNPDADKKAGNPFTVFTPKDGLNCCVQSMYQDREGNMWWGAGSGLFRFDGKQFYQVKQKGPW